MFSVSCRNRLRFVSTDGADATKMRAWKLNSPSELYARVSRKGQAADDGDGIVRQEQAIRAYAAKNRAIIMRWFRDSVAGTRDLENRPALQELMSALHRMVLG